MNTAIQFAGNYWTAAERHNVNHREIAHHWDSARTFSLLPLPICGVITPHNRIVYN